MSLAIVALVAVPLIGMLSVGLESNNRSAERAVFSQIVDQVGREVEQIEFSNLPPEFPTYHFDDQGVRVDAMDPSWIYITRVRVLKATDLPDSEGTRPSQSLARVQVEIAVNPGDFPSSVLFEEDENGELTHPAAKRFTLHVSRDD